MKAAVYYGHKDLRIMDMPEPGICPGNVKVQVGWAGICGTDRHEYTGPNFIRMTAPHPVTGKMAPLILGHEFSGKIVAIGDGVTGWKIGDRVTASGNIVCGECRWCRSGRVNLCENLAFNGIGQDGCFAEAIVVPQYQLFRIPKSVSLEAAVLAEPLACGVHATNLIGDLTGQTVAIVGPGIIGISCLLAAKAAGASKILVVGSGKVTEERMRHLCADAYVDVKSTDPIEFGRMWTHGAMFDTVYECVGIDATLETSIQLARKAGTVMVMGVYEKPPKISMNYFQEGERILLTSQAYVDELGTVLERMALGQIPSNELITARIPLDRIVDEGFEELLNFPDKHAKIVVHIADLE
jgi:(R,R)-butanediol dehydrogenase/meso-butanediol dehydrogenase/diacetyl reductase